jgi:energy-converting hydrogenase Eha subunit A
MTRNSAILMEFDPSSRILVKNVIVIRVEALTTKELNIKSIAEADVGTVAGILINLY